VAKLPFVNEEIEADQVQLVGDDRKLSDALSLDEALAEARRGGLDLIQVAQKNGTSICRIASFRDYVNAVGFLVNSNTCAGVPSLHRFSPTQSHTHSLSLSLSHSLSLTDMYVVVDDVIAGSGEERRRGGEACGTRPRCKADEGAAFQ
jgi:Translation initiation factor IF-3, N-terminal domain